MHKDGSPLMERKSRNQLRLYPFPDPAGRKKDVVECLNAFFTLLWNTYSQI